MFSGRASRPEYWYFFLFVAIVNIATSILDTILFDYLSIFNLIATLALLLPSIAVGVRRSHDIDRFGLMPVAGWIALTVWFCQPGTTGPNQFGSDPLSDSIATAQPAQA